MCLFEDLLKKVFFFLCLRIRVFNMRSVPMKIARIIFRHFRAGRDNLCLCSGILEIRWDGKKIRFRNFASGPACVSSRKTARSATLKGPGLDDDGASFQKKISPENTMVLSIIMVFFFFSCLFRFGSKVLISYGNLECRRPTGRSILILGRQVARACLRLLEI